MLSHEQSMDSGQHRLFAVTRIPRLKAQTRLWLALGILRGLRQQVLANTKAGGVEAAAEELAQLSHLANVGAIDVGGVSKGGDLVHLLSVQGCQI